MSAKAKRERRSFLGDPFPLVPMTHFTKIRVDLLDAWKLVGPTIDRNAKNTSPQDLYCIAFIEGMRMALHALETHND